MTAREAAEQILKFAPITNECGGDNIVVAAQIIEHLSVVVGTLDGVGTAKLRRAWTRCTFEHRWRVARQITWAQKWQAAKQAAGVGEGAAELDAAREKVTG